MSHEYKVVPAPQKGLKAKGVKGTPARFANALETLMNELAQDGWDYVRADTLPVEERQGLTGKTTTYQNMLVFRRAIDEAVEEDAPVVATIAEEQSEPEVTEPEVDPEMDENDVAAEEARDDDARQRVDETLKSDVLSLRWKSRNGADATKSDDPTLPAE